MKKKTYLMMLKIFILPANLLAKMYMYVELNNKSSRCLVKGTGIDQ